LDRGPAVGQRPLADGQGDIPGCRRSQQRPALRIRRYGHTVVSGLAGGKATAVDTAARTAEGQILHLDRPGVPQGVVPHADAAALQGVAQRGVRRILCPADTDVVGARLQRRSHAGHDQGFASPLVAGQPAVAVILVGIWIAQSRGIQVSRKLLAPHHHARLPAGDVGQPQVPPQGPDWHRHLEPSPGLRWLVGDVCAALGEPLQRCGDLPGGQLKGTQGLIRGIDPHVPDIRLVSRLLQKTEAAGQIHMVRIADRRVIGTPAVAVAPAGRDGVPSEGYRAARHLAGQVELPAEETDLGADIADLVVAPAGAACFIVGNRNVVVGIGVSRRDRVRIGGIDVGSRRDGRVLALQGVGKAAVAVDGDIPGTIGESGRDLGNAVGHAGGRLGKGAVHPAVGYVALADVHIRILVRCTGCQVHLPGDLLDGHIDPVGDIAEAVVITARKGELEIVPPGDTNLLFAGIKAEAGSRSTVDADEICGVGQVGGHQQHLPGLGLLCRLDPGRLDRGLGLLDIHREVDPVEPEPPGQCIGIDAGLEVPGPFRADGNGRYAARIRQASQIVDIHLAAEDVPGGGCSASMDAQVPGLVVGKLACSKDCAVGAGAGGLIVRVRQRRCSLLQVEVGLPGLDVQDRAPGTACRGRAGDAEEVVTAVGGRLADAIRTGRRSAAVPDELLHVEVAAQQLPAGPRGGMDTDVPDLAVQRLIAIDIDDIRAGSG